MELETNRIDKRKNNEIRPFSIYPYNFYFTNETSREIINSTYKTLDNINVIGAFETFDKFSNFITNITEYDFIKYSSSCPVDNVTLIKN